MRTLPLTLVLLTCSVSAQDMNTYMQQALAKQGVKMEPDTDPFVPNTFVGSFTMEMHMFKNGVESEHSPTNMTYWSSPEMTLVQTAMAVEKQGHDMKMMTDLKGKWQYMLMYDGKSKTAMKSPKMKVTMQADATHPTTSKPTVTVTDDTKTIDGHVCKKVVIKSDDGTWTGWVAEDLQAPFGDMARNIRSGDAAMMQRMGEIKGFPLEYEWVATKDGDRIV